MKLILVVVAFCLCGCSNMHMPLAEQIAATKACRDAGGRPHEVTNGLDGGLVRVDCSLAEPRSPGKPCEDKGGVPILSSWDGTLSDCIFKPRSVK